VPGDLVETGACKGGACIFMRALLKAAGDDRRKVVVCDTFHPSDPPPPLLLRVLLGIVMYVVASVPSQRWKRGLCKTLQKLDPNFPPIEEPSEEMVDLAISIIKSVMFLQHSPRVEKSLDCVKSNFARFGLLDNQVVFLQGWFSDTLPNAPIASIAVLRLDGDTYESTMDALQLLYPRLSAGGYCIIDDYWSFDDCRRAVDEYRLKHAITAELVRIDGLACFWQR
jgi:O-methyltransferase